MERKITIEESVVYKEDYQMRMLRMNEIEGLLPVKGRGVDGVSVYDYNVSGKISMKAMYERNKISGEDLKTFLKQLLAVIQSVENYLLNIDRILMDPEYIFYENGNYYFCYYPQEKQELWEAFHLLTEYFVKQADYEDKECVRIVFILHKETMAENYHLEKIVKKCIKGGETGGKKEQKKGAEPGRSEIIRKIYGEDDEEEEVGQEGIPKRNPGIRAGTYDTSEHDWIERQHRGSLIMEETENMWTPVKKLLNRRKKPKWGDWDGLYIEEEEL